jgi:Spy/CpxP family protein refolding chaperone
VKWKAFVVLLGVFLLGVGGGVAIDRVALHRDGFAPYRVWDRHRPPVNRILQRLTHALDLSEAQQQDVHAIVMATRTELDAARQDMRNRVDDILQASETRIRRVLQPEQREAFEQLMAEHRARREQRRHFRRRHMPHESEKDLHRP